MAALQADDVIMKSVASLEKDMKVLKVEVEEEMKEFRKEINKWIMFIIGAGFGMVGYTEIIFPGSLY